MVDYWPLGRITAVNAGRDYCARVVGVQVGDTSFDRPVTALCP